MMYDVDTVWNAREAIDREEEGKRIAALEEQAETARLIEKHAMTVLRNTRNGGTETVSFSVCVNTSPKRTAADYHTAPTLAEAVRAAVKVALK